MKKIFTYPLIAVMTALLLTSCVKSVYVDDDSYWLTQEEGVVVFSDSNCGYYVVETNYGYTIIRSVSGFRPYEGSIMYGNFGMHGTRNFYNYSSGIVVTGQVVEVDLSYIQAQYAVEYYCPYAVGYKIKQNPQSSEKLKREVH